MQMLVKTFKKKEKKERNKERATETLESIQKIKTKAKAHLIIMSHKQR